MDPGRHAAAIEGVLGSRYANLALEVREEGRGGVAVRGGALLESASDLVGSSSAGQPSRVCKRGRRNARECAYARVSVRRVRSTCPRVRFCPSTPFNSDSSWAVCSVVSVGIRHPQGRRTRGKRIAE
eukprot:GHVU01131001.1.p1 GENE.GHVU01131001.1~~GHVU01131001.1.p1  ORF type:complete len:127 (+),score=3.33 GHVU01131001.1:467-847(+)